MTNYFMGIDSKRDLLIEQAIEELERQERAEIEHARQATENYNISNPSKVIGAQ